jgi:hypothetical protein
MIRLQRWESGPYFADFSLHIPDMRSFFHMLEIVKICPRSRPFLSDRCFAIEHLSLAGCECSASLLTVQKMTRIHLILRYKSSRGVRTGARSRGPVGDATA